MASDSGTLYTGITSNLEVRVYQHKRGVYPGFSKKYKCHKLIYYEQFNFVNDAIDREKQIKKWNRKKKENIIKMKNPKWIDLSRDWILGDDV